MNIARAFVSYLEDMGIGTFGTDLFIHRAPSSNETLDSIWWVKSSGGTPVKTNVTGERRKSYLVEVFYRNRDSEAVYESMQALEEQVNLDMCTQLSGYDTLDIEATAFPVDQDLDDEDRSVGLLQASITTYKGFN